MSASAYERVYLNPVTTGYGTTTSTGSGYYTAFGNAASTQAVEIDCRKLGISEIASTTFKVWNGSGTYKIKLTDLVSGRLSQTLGENITTTAADRSFVFNPPIWCDGGHVVLARHGYVTSVVYFGMDPNTDSTASDVNAGGAWTFSLSGQSSPLGALVNKTPMMWVEGSYSTSTGGGGNSTTTYNFYTATTSPTEAIEQLTTVHLAFALLIVLFLTAIITYTFTYGRSRPT